MTIDTVLRTVASTLVTSLSSDTSHIRVMPDAYPAPSMGKWFISVYGGRFKKIDENSYCIRGPFEFNLTMTFRVNAIPFDRQGTDLTAKATTGTIAIFETAVRSIEGNTTIVSTTNSALGYTGLESGPILINADFEAKPIRGGGPIGWLNAANQERAGFIFEASFKTYISIPRS